jgi:hypothetical protein
VNVGESTEDEHVLNEKINAVMDTLADPSGTFYRFSMAHSLLQRVKVNGNGDNGGKVK